MLLDICRYTYVDMLCKQNQNSRRSSGGALRSTGHACLDAFFQSANFYVQPQLVNNPGGIIIHHKKPAPALSFKQKLQFSLGTTGQFSASIEVGPPLPVAILRICLESDPQRMQEMPVMPGTITYGSFVLSAIVYIYHHIHTNIHTYIH